MESDENKQLKLTVTTNLLQSLILLISLEIYTTTAFKNYLAAAKF